MSDVSFRAEHIHRDPAGNRTQDLVNTSFTEPLQKSTLITAGLEVLADLSVTLLEHIAGLLADSVVGLGHLYKSIA